MIQKTVLGTGTKQRRLIGRSYSRTSASTAMIALLLMAGLSSIKVISSCVISPSESVAIVGDLSSFSCNARPNNQQQSSISFIRLGSDGASGTDIFRPSSQGPGGRIIIRQFLADGYFIPHLDDSHSIVTIQINETQLKHGGEYFCTCVESTSSLGTANFIVIDKLSFVRSGDEALTPGTLVDLNCSVSFNGSASSAFIDLTISDANGIHVSTKRNLPLTKNVTGHHAIHSKVVVDPKDQRFSCEMKVWNKSSTGESPLRSITSNFSLNWDYMHVTTSAHHSTSTAPNEAGRTALILVGVIATLLLVAAFVVVVFVYKKCLTRSITNEAASSHSVGQRSRHKDAEVSVPLPLHVKPSQYPADPNYESIDEENRIAGSNQTYEELNLNDHSIQTDQPHYESIDKEKRIVESNQEYEELDLNDHPSQTGLYIDIIA